MPRFNDDIIFLSGPKIIQGPDIKKIEPYALEISWQTDVVANSIIMFGLTSQFEIDTLTFWGGTGHAVCLNNLCVLLKSGLLTLVRVCS
jgi:hypothetical protein